MAKNRLFSLVTVAAATVSTLIAACSSSSKNSGTPSGTDSGSSADAVTTTDAPDTDAAYLTGGLTGCSPLEPGCYKQSGAYTVPTTNPTCSMPSKGTTSGAADSHCNGVTPQTVNPASCDVMDAGPMVDSGPTPDAGAPGPCGENGPDYGATMYGNEGDDDDCKYHVTWTATPICENTGTYFVVTADYLTRNSAPLTGACTFAEVCLNNTHPGPNIDSRPPAGNQTVVEGPPGTYTIGPVQFDAAGDWTVRFHFNEICCDIANDSPHGHAAFHITVP
jgi:hypothetical protein